VVSKRSLMFIIYFVSHLVVTNKQWIIAGEEEGTTRLERFIIEICLEHPDIAVKVI
jgi:hypothetical protein